MADMFSSRNTEFGAGAVSHAYQPNLIPYTNHSTLNPTAASSNGLDPKTYGQHLSGLKQSANGASDETYQKGIQLQFPYLHTFGG